MPRTPKSAEVDKALKEAKRKIDGALKALNQSVSKAISQGDYTKAEELISKGKTFADFRDELDAIRQRWKSVTFIEREPGTQTENTPLWGYYQTILTALEAMGGQATRKEIEQHIERDTANLKPGDLGQTAQGRPRWKMMVRKARKYLTKEGFVQEGKGPVWRITPEGQRVARASSIAVPRMS